MITILGVKPVCRMQLGMLYFYARYHFSLFLKCLLYRKFDSSTGFNINTYGSFFFFENLDVVHGKEVSLFCFCWDMVVKGHII